MAASAGPHVVPTSTRGPCCRETAAAAARRAPHRLRPRRRRPASGARRLRWSSRREL